jgi:hypothetical protein
MPSAEFAENVGGFVGGFIEELRSYGVELTDEEATILVEGIALFTANVISILGQMLGLLDPQDDPECAFAIMLECLNKELPEFRPLVDRIGMEVRTIRAKRAREDASDKADEWRGGCTKWQKKRS